MSEPGDLRRRDALRIIAGTIGVSVTGVAAECSMLPKKAFAQQTDDESAASTQLRSIFAAQQWLNSAPLNAEELRGRVVLVNFWTYSCINSLRMLPYTRAWHEKYKDSGLTVIGAHTPEFEFEKDIAKVTWAMGFYGVNYPVALDSTHDIWRAFGNDAWPALYFIDNTGRSRRRAVGEGDYDKHQKFLRQLLTEARNGSVANGLTVVNGAGPEAAPDWADLRSPETYVGYARATNFVSPGGIKRDVSNIYRAASRSALNQWSLAGDWTVGKEFALLNAAGGSIQFRFHARDLHLILGHAPQTDAIKFRIKIDGAPPGASHGVDTSAEGDGSLLEDRMYQLVRQTGPVKDRTCEIEFSEPGARAYDFTFG
jgi:thiol-disulfide isomerase/thioredoxin